MQVVGDGVIECGCWLPGGGAGIKDEKVSNYVVQYILTFIFSVFPGKHHFSPYTIVEKIKRVGRIS